jgi:hypothetical protein
LELCRVSGNKKVKIVFPFWNCVSGNEKMKIAFFVLAKNIKVQPSAVFSLFKNKDLPAFHSLQKIQPLFCTYRNRCVQDIEIYNWRWHCIYISAFVHPWTLSGAHILIHKEGRGRGANLVPLPATAFCNTELLALDEAHT